MSTLRLSTTGDTLALGKPAPGSAAWLRLRLFSIPMTEANVSRRGFARTTEAMHERREMIGRTFLDGYHAAMGAERLGAAMAGLLAVTPREDHGFALEGAAMGWMLRVCLTPSGGVRWQEFVERHAASHIYMAHVGAGWVMARLPFSPVVVTRHLDPLLKWLAFDGCGFHDGYFNAPQTLKSRLSPPNRFTGYQRRAYDQGVGRSLWFVTGGDPARIRGMIAACAAERRADLWSGVGLACAYAGGVPKEVICEVREQAEADGALSHVAQGVAFAAKARDRAKNFARHTDVACRILCGRSMAQAAHITDVALESIGTAYPAEPGTRTTDMPRYERWRMAIRARCSDGIPTGKGI